MSKGLLLHPNPPHGGDGDPLWARVQGDDNRIFIGLPQPTEFGEKIGSDMNNILGLILFGIGFIYFSYIGFLVWFRPKRYIIDLQKKKKNSIRSMGFLPKWIINIAFIYDQHRLSLWWGRLWITILIIICFLGAITAINGPLDILITNQ